MKGPASLLTLAVLIGVASTPRAAMPSGTFHLAVPELKLEVDENSAAAIPYSLVSRLELTVLRSSQEIPPGKVIVRINGEAANIIMSSRTNESGIVCSLDLNFRPGFLLHAGRNAIEASAQSIYGRAYYAVFLLDVRDEPESLRAVQWESAVSQLGERPPQIHLLEPQGVVENVRELTVKGFIEGGAAPVAVAIQGESVTLKAAPAPPGGRGVQAEGRETQYSFSIPVALSAKQASIEVVATDAHRNRGRAVIPVVHGTRVPSQRWAVVIGVSRYSDSHINLQFADRDAEAMKDFLQDPKGGAVPSANMFYRVNEQATSSTIRAALFDFLSKPGPDDLVIVYFAGHGANDPKSPDNYYLLGYDADPNNLGATAVRMRELQESFGNYLKANLVTLVDACHSGGIGKAVTNMTNVRWTNAGFGEHRAIITASDVGEFSREDTQWGGGHGVFTYYVLQGLKGEADANHDHKITVGELFDYVNRHVAGATGGAQRPQALARSERTFVLSQEGSRAALSGWAGAQFFAGGRPQ